MPIDCAKHLKALADKTRLAVIHQLMEGPKYVGELNACLKIEQSALSHHLRILRQAGLIIAERNGKAVLYSLAPEVELHLQQRALDLGCCRLYFNQLPSPVQE